MSICVFIIFFFFLLCVFATLIQPVMSSLYDSRCGRSPSLVVLKPKLPFVLALTKSYTMLHRARKPTLAMLVECRAPLALLFSVRASIL